MNDDQDDRTQLKLVAGGGAAAEGAAAKLVDRFQPKLYRYFLGRRASASDAQDLCQQTLIAMFTAAKSFRSEASVWTWVRAIATNELLGHLRKMKRSADLIDFVEDASELEARVEPSREELFDCIELAFRNLVVLAPTKAATLERIVVDGLGVPEVAALLNRNLGATRTFLWECRKVLRQLAEPCRELLAEAME